MSQGQDFNAKGDIELSLKFSNAGELDEFITNIGRAENEIDGLNPALDKVSREAVKARRSLGDAGDGAEELASKSAAAEASLPRLRYALYDVASTATFTGAALTASSVAAFAAAVSYERSFADVIRTNDALMESSTRAGRAYGQFVDLAGEMPTTFSQLSEIGTLAGQLGIASGRLVDFSEAVGMFSATTGESIETTATAFGRLDALLPDVNGNYQALGSAILNVGINSVATEGEIIKITTQLAGVGRQAGLSTADLVGLSGALASVGVQPELARGTITRLFGEISRAISTGGEKLDGFAAIAGTTASSFESKWNSAPMQATLDIFRGLRDRGSEAEAALRSVGITSVRDVPAILRLSQTVDSVLVPALSDAADGVEQQTQLADNYGVIAETTASKLRILANNFQSLLAALGQSSIVFKGVLDIANGMLVTMRELAENPVASFFVQTGVVATALTGILLLLVGAATRGAASFLAMRTAMAEAGVTSAGLRGNLSALAMTVGGVNAQAATASGTLGKLGGVIGVVSKVSLVLAAVPVATWLQDVAKDARGASVDVDTLGKALAQLGSEGADSVDIQNVIDKAILSIGKNGALLSAEDIGLSKAVAEELDIASSALDTGALSLATEFRGVFGNIFNATELDGIGQWFYSSFDPLYQEISAFEGAWIQAWESASSETQKQAVIDSFNGLRESVIAAGGDVGAFDYNLRGASEAMSEGVDLTKLQEERNLALADSYQALQDEMVQIVDDSFAAVNAQYALDDALSRVGQALVEEGAAAAFSGATMQSAIKAVIEQSGSAPAAAANLQLLFDYIVQGGYASAAQLVELNNVIAGLRGASGGKIAAPTMSMPDFSALTSGYDAAAASMGRAGGAARQAAKEVRTLKDYASDLAKVWDRAFEIRFSGQSTLDSITSAWSKIRKEIDDAAEAIAKYQAEMQSLNADKSTMQYWLMVAESYGDTLRANELRAKLAETDAKLAETQKKLAAEQEEANKTLTGNSDAAIKNRAEILDLVQSYQDHIGALASSGLSQDELRAKTEQLRQQFIEQAVQLGYSRSEVMKYAAAFNDVTTAINKVPRNITVEADTDPAIQSLNEMRAAADKASSAMSGLRSNASRGVPAVDSYGNRQRALMAELLAAEAILDELRRARDVAGMRYQAQGVARLRHQLATGQFRDGGYTGDGGVNDVAGVVHGKEFVFSAPAVANLGVQNLAMLHEMAKGGRASAGTVNRFGNGPLEVELSPYDRQLLVDVKNAMGVTFNGTAMQRFVGAGAVNSGRTGRG